MNLNIVVAGAIYVYAPYAIYITWLYIMPAEICQLCGMACCAEREREKFGYKRIVRINGIDNFMATTALCLTRQAGHTHTHKEGTEGEGGKCS